MPLKDGLKGNLKDGLKSGGLKDGLSKMKKMREKVKKEIDHIPRGDQAQNYLRMYYWPFRMNSLKIGDLTKEQVLRGCIKKVKEEFKTFEPKYDTKFFKM